MEIQKVAFLERDLSLRPAGAEVKAGGASAFFDMLTGASVEAGMPVEDVSSHADESAFLSARPETGPGHEPVQREAESLDREDSDVRSADSSEAEKDNTDSVEERQQRTEKAAEASASAARKTEESQTSENDALENDALITEKIGKDAARVLQSLSGIIGDIEKKASDPSEKTSKAAARAGRWKTVEDLIENAHRQKEVGKEGLQSVGARLELKPEARGAEIVADKDVGERNKHRKTEESRLEDAHVRQRVEVFSARDVQASIDAKPEGKSKIGLDASKWNIVSARHERREAAKSDSQESSQGGREFRESGLPNLFRTVEQPVSPQELERGVRSGLNELVKKAHVQIGRQGQASAQIRMNPEHLGFMSVDMKVEANRVVLKILVDREDVLEQLKKDLDVLRTEFGKSGLHIDSLSIKLRESFGTAFQNDTQEQKDTAFQDDGSQQGGQNPSQDEKRRGYFESAFTTSEVEEPHPAAVSGEIGQSGYENQLVMNFHRPADQRVFRA